MKKAVYIAIGIDLNGRKDVSGYVGRRKRERQILGDCTQWSEERGVEDIFIACTDNLTGFDAAIHASFLRPRSKTASSTSCAIPAGMCPYKDLKALMADLKAVYAAIDEQAALNALDAFGERWTGNTRESPSPGGRTGPI